VVLWRRKKEVSEFGRKASEKEIGGLWEEDARACGVAADTWTRERRENCRIRGEVWDEKELMECVPGIQRCI
jgi:hypothetical protein